MVPSFDMLRIWSDVSVDFRALYLRHVLHIVVYGAATSWNNRIELVLKLLYHVSLLMNIT